MYFEMFVSLLLYCVFSAIRVVDIAVFCKSYIYIYVTAQ